METTYKNINITKAQETKWSIPRLTEQEKIDGYYKGLQTGATHMLIVWDTFDFEGSYDFIVHCPKDTSVTDLVNYYSAPGFYRVSAVYAMHLSLEEQSQEVHPWHTEYP